MQYKIRSFRYHHGVLTSGAPNYAGLEDLLKETAHGGWALVSLALGAPSHEPSNVHSVIAVFQRPDGEVPVTEREAVDALIEVIEHTGLADKNDLAAVERAIKAVRDARKVATGAG